VAVDEALARQLLEATPLIREAALPHAQEHALEVELPFLQRRLGRFSIVPLLISTTGLGTCREVGEAIARTLKGRRVLILISSDLSHYVDQETARDVDGAMLAALMPMRPALLRETSAMLMARGTRALKTTMCGQGALLTGLYAARALGANQASVLHYRTSGSVDRGDPGRVVGYAAVAFLRSDSGAPGAQAPFLDAGAREHLLMQASRSIREGLEGRPEPPRRLSDDPMLTRPAAVFVTVTLRGRLRGCRGSTSPSKSLLEQVTHFAREAAFHDPRFPPLTRKEFEASAIKISILSPPERVDSPEQIVPGTHGVRLTSGGRSGVFLPSVWDKLPTTEQFLSTLCTQKAGLSAACWRDPQTTLEVFTTTDFDN
jgi:AmmeMemoRadiSam system protein A